MIIKRARADNFAIIPNSVLEDERLSIEARGTLCYLLGKPHNWQIHITDIQKRCGMGKDKTYRVIKELRDVGYLESRMQRNEKGQSCGQEYILYDVADVRARPLPEKPETVEPLPEKPFPEKPEAENKELYIITDNKIILTDISGSSLCSEPESSVSGETDNLSNAQARGNSQNENPQTQNQTPLQEQNSNKKPNPQSANDLGHERNQVAPPPLVGRGVARDGGGGDVSEQSAGLDAPPAAKAKPRKLAYPADFEAAWKSYPTTPNMSKKEGFDQWRKIDDEDRHAVVMAIPRYRQFLREKPDHPVIHFCRFISKRRFDGFVEQEGGSSVQGGDGASKPTHWVYGDASEFSDEQWAKALNLARHTLRWLKNWGAMPGDTGCIVPERLLRTGEYGDGYLWQYVDENGRVAA